jgi:hypothetical protein
MAAFNVGTEEVLFPALSQRYSLTALVMQILLIPGGLALLPVLPPLLTPLPVAAYLFAVLFRYPSLRQKFKRPRLWIEFGAVALLAGVLLGVLAPEGSGTWWTGLQSGIVMTARATLVVAAFSAISFELRNPAVVNWFLQRGLGSVSAALQMAFRALPAMIQSLNSQRHSIRHPLRGLSQMLIAMHALLGETSGIRSQPKIYLLTGRQGEGKTTLLEKAVGQLRDQGVVVGGILAYVRREPGSTQSSGRIGYDIENILTGERAALCRTDHEEPERRSAHTCSGRGLARHKGFGTGLQVVRDRDYRRKGPLR